MAALTLTLYGYPVWLAPIAAALLTILALILLIRLAPTLGLMDNPGGRKDHAAPTPVVGGIAITFAALLTSVALSLGVHILTLLICALIVLIAGMLDDMREISQYPRFAAQVVGCVFVIALLDVSLRSVGNLFGFGPVGLSFIGLPMTVFAVVGVINAVNMSDGLDGLAGSQCLIAVLAFAWAAHAAGLTAHVYFLLSLAGGLIAFLLFNLRLPWQSRAKVFMGDAGSMTFGFLLGWMAVDLTQGPGRSLPPICALWVVVIPLCDTVSLILRRRAAGGSPMTADREHLHHQLLARGFSVSQAVAIVAISSMVCALIGIGGWQLGLPEPVLFALFVALFLAHHYASKRFWRRHYALSAGTRAIESPLRAVP